MELLFLSSARLLPAAYAQIAFASNRGGNYNIYVMNADGSNLRQLTNDPAWDTQPAWSPDGRQMAFISDRGGLDGIYVMNADGSDPHFLIRGSVPAWSPQGDQIVYLSGHPQVRGFFALYVMNLRENNSKQLSDLVVEGRAAWSPNGTKIAFANPFAISVMNSDGSNVARLTDQKAQSGSPTWSPDGTQIAFPRHDLDGNGRMEIYVMNADGTNLRRLTNHPAWDGGPSWSADGRRIAFSSVRDGNAEIYVIDVDGQNLRNLTNHPAEDSYPAWFPATAGAVVAPVGKLATSWAHSNGTHNDA